MASFDDLSLKRATKNPANAGGENIARMQGGKGCQSLKKPDIHSLHFIAITFLSPVFVPGFFYAFFLSGQHKLRLPIFSIRPCGILCYRKVLCFPRLISGQSFLLRFFGHLNYMAGYYRLVQIPPPPITSRQIPWAMTISRKPIRLGGMYALQRATSPCAQTL